MKNLLAVLAAIAAVLAGGEAMALGLTSSSFKDGSAIPSRFTCDGANVSPDLGWSGAPANTKSFALISDDPDAPAGTWVHWVAWNIPSTSTGFKESVPPTAKLADGTMQGMTDFRKPGYGGPCPPSGTHRYYFKLYALDGTLTLPASTTKADLVAAMAGHILAETSLMGTYSRQR
jgi:Raf kinase inhibitor-like YbhB/YbcL family protein